MLTVKKRSKRFNKCFIAFIKLEGIFFAEYVNEFTFMDIPSKKEQLINKFIKATREL